MNDQDKVIPHQWFDRVWNQGLEAAIDEMLTDDIIAHGLVDAQGNTIHDKDTFKTYFRGFRAAFPDIHVTVEDTVAEGDKIVALCRVTATHQGHELGFKATQQPVEFTGMCMLRIENGKIAEAWNAFDFLGMLQQIGAVQVKSAGQ
jgi:steroid delta-isomerase-like uncharacterized protein